MPTVSEKQQKAMFAAAHGRSRIGIPKKVGKEFSMADEARGPGKLPADAKRKSHADKLYPKKESKKEK